MQSVRSLLLKAIPYGVVLLVSVWAITPSGLALEQRLGLDVLFKMRGPVVSPQNVAVIAITRNSARTLGLPEKLYQWSRQSHAELVNALSDLNARLIVFDVFFETERDQQGDQAFAQAIKQAGNVLLFSRSQKEMLEGAEMESFLQPYAPFAESALDVAPLILPKVPARVSRFFLRHPSFINVPTLPTRAWRIVSADNPSQQGLPDLSDARPDPLLNLYGPPRTITTLEFADVVNRTPRAQAAVENRVVFVGYSAADQPDQRDGFYTSFSNDRGLDVSGVELAATAYANLAEGHWLREWLPWQNGVLLLLVGIVSFSVARYSGPMVAAISVAGLVLLITGLIYAAFTRLFLWLPWFHTVVVMLPVAGAMGMWLRNRELFNQKRRLQWAFGKYLPRDELERLVVQQGLPAVRDYHNSVCMVTDAQGYSRLSETLSPADLGDLMQSYYHAIIPPIRQSGGIISDVAGDGVIALWLHLDRENAWQSLQPVVAQINQNIARFNAEHPGRELPTRIGIHSGEIVLGHFGAMDHHEFRAMGDIINTTSRLEGANKQLGTEVLISESCALSSDDSLRYLGRFKFVGKQQPLGVFTVKNVRDPVLLKQYRLAIMKLEAGQIEGALKLFSTVKRYYADDGPTGFAVQKINALIEDHDLELLAKGIIPFSSK